MALGCLLWVSWICCLLFDGTGAGLHTKKGYRHPHSSDTHNLGNDEQDEDVSALSFDDWQGSIGQPGADPGYIKPSRAKQPAVVPTRRPKTNAPEVGLVNGETRDWGQENLNEPLTFPLKPKHQPQPDPVQPPLFNIAASNASPSRGVASQYAEPNPYQAVNPPGFYWQQKPVPSGPAAASSPSQDPNAGTYGGDSSEIPNLVYEEVFDYPSENAAQSQSSSSTSETTGGNDQSPYVSQGSSTDYSSEPVVPSYPDPPTPGKGNSNSGRKNLNSGQVVYQPPKWRRPQKPAKKVVSQRVSEPILPPPPPPPPPPRYIIQYRDGYQRFRELLNTLKYSTEFEPMPVSNWRVRAAPQE